MIRVGIDLGCDHIRLVSHEEGLVFDEPSMVAFDKKGHVLAIGNEARDMKELMNDDIRIVSPLLTNNIDFDALHALIDQLCYDYHVFRMLKKTILLFSYPTNLSNELCEELKNTYWNLVLHAFILIRKFGLRQLVPSWIYFCQSQVVS